MDTERMGLILWIVSGLLMAAGVLGVGLAVILDRKAVSPSAEARPARRRESRAVAAREEAPPKPVDEKALASRKAAYRQGIYVLVGLAVLTALEFWVARALGGSAVFLFVIALVKGGVIIQYYMHLNRVWEGEEAHS